MYTRQIRRAVVAAGMTAALAITAAGCSSDSSDTASSGADGGGMTTSTRSGDAARPDDVNDTDVEFVRGMIPHHQQAVAMADMVVDHGADPEVIALAEQITAAQGPEIDEMQSWLDDWAVRSDDMHDMAGSDSMGNGMMSAHEMDSMSASTGGDLDQLFLEMMIRHHEGAIEMARVELDGGSNQDVIALAQHIIETQQREIDQMQSMTDGT